MTANRPDRSEITPGTASATPPQPFKARARARLAAFNRRVYQAGVYSAFLFALIGAIFVFIALIRGAGATEATTGAGIVPAPVHLSSIEKGGLYFHAAEPGMFVKAPVVASKVDIDVEGAIVRATVTQSFQNPSDGWIEGIYLFPLPETAAVDTLKMRIGSRFIEGRIKERAQARKIYEDAKAKGLKAALVEQQRPNMFSNAVANIGPGESVVVQIEYQQEVARTGGEYSFRVPLVVAPRYQPGEDLKLASTDGQIPPAGDDGNAGENKGAPGARAGAPVQNPALGKRNPVDIAVHLDAGFPLDTIKSHHHDIKMERSGDQVADISLKDSDNFADRDFELSWTAKPGAEPALTLYRQTVRGQHYLTAMIAPPAKLADAPEPPAREVIFVIDTSGSMAGTSMREAKHSLAFALERLRARDSFNIIRFSDTTHALFARPVAADDAAKEVAASFVAALQADGGTEMLPALQTALRDMSAQASENGDEATQLRQVVFMTDGAISNEASLFAEIKANRGRSRIFTVGIGAAPNSHFMGSAAELGRGTFTHIGSETQVAQRMTTLLRQLEDPVMTALEVKWPDGTAAEAWPNPLPDLYRGQPVVIAAKLASMDGTVEITGKRAGADWSAKFELSKATEARGVARLWARRKIAELESRRYGGQNGELFDRAILDVALEHQLVSRLTSLVAVDITPQRPEGEVLSSRDVPLNLPAGWKFDKVFGESLDLREAAAPVRTQATAIASLLNPAPAPVTAAARARRRGIALPQGATQADRHIFYGLLLIAFAAMGIIVLMLWRHLAQAYAPPPRSL